MKPILFLQYTKHTHIEVCSKLQFTLYYYLDVRYKTIYYLTIFAARIDPRDPTAMTDN